jgi:hypothetical protein
MYRSIPGPLFQHDSPLMVSSINGIVNYKLPAHELLLWDVLTYFQLPLKLQCNRWYNRVQAYRKGSENFAHLSHCTRMRFTYVNTSSAQSRAHSLE